VHDKALLHSLQYGVAFIHEAMSQAEQDVVNVLFSSGAIQVRGRPCGLFMLLFSSITLDVCHPGSCALLTALRCIFIVVQVMVATASVCWGLSLGAHLVVVMGTQYYEAGGHGGANYPLTDLLQMLGKAGRPQVGFPLLSTLCPGLISETKNDAMSNHMHLN
jgi:pre-mRNA-splicing helicase BRR2